MASSSGRSARGTRKRSYKKYKRTSSIRTHRPTATELGLMGSLVGSSTLTQGVELKSGSFQEQQDLFMGGGKGRELGGCANDIADHILCFLELLNTIKIYHWSTLSYPTHKATDELHGKLSDLVDSFIEIYIGHCARGGRGAGAGVPRFRFKSEKDASIEFGWYLRPTLKFDSLEELLIKMKQDCDRARELTEK